jgi:hypothetical protein
VDDARGEMMNRKLDEELCRIAPRLFDDRYADMRSTALCWGFECGSGWHEILKDAATRLEPLIVAYIKAHPEERNPFPWLMAWDWRCVKWSLLHPFSEIRSLVEWLAVELGLKSLQPWWPRASQIKEKYGTLRFYMTSATNEMYAITDEAERRSAKTCEKCGQPGKLRGQGWLYTRCSPCWKKEQHEA